MQFLYTFSLRCYGLFLSVASLFNSRAKAWIRGREGWRKDLISKTRGFDGAVVVWFHCASLGEFEQGRPLIEELRTSHPQYKIIVSFFSPSGYAIRKHYKHADAVVYLPLDTTSNAKFWIETVKPRMAFFIKYEYWFNFLSELYSHKIPVVFVSAVFREEQLFFQWYGSWFRTQLEHIHWFFVQDEPSGALIQSLGFDNVTISGDTRFDRVSATAALAEEFPLVKKFCRNSRIIMGGSTWPGDESILIPMIRKQADGNIKFIIATHDVSEPRIHSLESALGVPFIRYSKLTGENAGSAGVLIIDTMGMLAGLYRYADLAFIGGAFGSGLHNILEAVVFGVPVFFGPKHDKFREAAALINSGGAFEINKPEEFAMIALSLLSDEVKYKEASDACLEFIKRNRGATQVIMEGTSSLL